jgi:FAD/FMN-containing dehydrogenase
MSEAPLLSGWGRIFGVGRSVSAPDLEKASGEAVLFRGLGRSYGDSALPPPSEPVVVSTVLADRIRFFDRVTGLFRAEAGLALCEINRLFLREGWFVPVTPGTQFVTLGGMVAADVHGKNHHVDGCFGDHVESLKLCVADGRIVECSMENEPELFCATIGGMGLTGHILEVTFRLGRIPTPWIWQETRRIDGIEDFVGALTSAASEWPFTVGWIDCLARGRALGRGILTCGRWASANEAPSHPPPLLRSVGVPFVFPHGVLNRWVVRGFNAAYYRFQGSRPRRGIVHPEKFFYPLDSVREWNRIYGPRGFTQYQCVLPKPGDLAHTREFFGLLTRFRAAPFLCVLKDCGPEGRGMISFPMPGISIALDIPVRPETRALVDTLNEFVIAAGGRIYLCKDSFTRPEHFRAMEPRLESWLAVRRKWNPEGRIRSAQSVRLFGDKP